MGDQNHRKSSEILQHLSNLLQERKLNLNSNSYSSLLFLGGIEKINRKIEEESGELVEAAMILKSVFDSSDEKECDAARHQVVHEAADLVYHLLVLLTACDLALADVEEELEKRSGISGLKEKASRTIENEKK
ncbi:MAG: phosphoribosyl-ATP diphosphatase [Planctomycetaceae bacterium]|nr:phosphoribosyl-ATP diphosphatase [Planctomycetaceae bacterium]